MLRVAAFVMFGVHPRIGIPIQQMRTDGLNELRGDSGPMPGYFARRLFPFAASFQAAKNPFI